MSAVLAITFPFFALVLCGWLATRRGLLPAAAIPGLNGFVLYFALPCLLYRFGAGTPIGRLLDAGGIALYLGCALAMVATAVVLARRAGIGWNDTAFGALVAAFPNTGFMGVPLLTALLGPAAAGPTIQAIAIDMVVTSSLCIALSRLDGAGQGGTRAALRQALRGMAGNPMPWAIVLGGGASATGLALPGPVDATVALLAQAATPVALFSIGAVLARAGMEQAPGREPGGVLPVVVLKLLVHPLLLFGAGHAAIALGAPLDRAAVAALVLVGALPSASNVSLLAVRFGADNARIARIILATTALAFLSFSAAVALLA